MNILDNELVKKLEKAIICKCACEGRGGEHECSCLPGIKHRCYPPADKFQKKESVKLHHFGGCCCLGQPNCPCTCHYPVPKRECECRCGHSKDYHQPRPADDKYDPGRVCCGACQCGNYQPQRDEVKCDCGGWMTFHKPECALLRLARGS